MRLGKIANNQDKLLKLTAKQSVSEFMIMQNLLFYVSSRHNSYFSKLNLSLKQFGVLTLKPCTSNLPPKSIYVETFPVCLHEAQLNFCLELTCLGVFNSPLTKTNGLLHCFLFLAGNCYGNDLQLNF